MKKNKNAQVKEQLEQLKIKAAQMGGVQDQVNESHKLLDIIGYDLKQFIDALRKEGLDEPQRQFLRRSFIRNLFSSIEAMTFDFKSRAIVFAELFNVDLSLGEINVIKEKEFKLNDKGDIEESKLKINTTTNFLFGFKIFNKSFNGNFAIEKNSKEWEDFKSAIKIRDRITHPKSFQSLVITDDELETVVKMTNWYLKSIAAMLTLSAGKFSELRIALKGKEDARPAKVKKD